MLRFEPASLQHSEMNTAIWLTRGTIWAALVCYILTVCLDQLRPRSARISRLVWTLGCLLLFAHIAAAFHFHHHWSHFEAAEETRRQTLQQVGLNFGFCIYFNHLFALVWLADCASWWARGAEFRSAHKWWFLSLHAFFLFMIFNGTVVFGRGWARSAGAILCGIAIVLLARRRRVE